MRFYLATAYKIQLAIAHPVHNLTYSEINSYCTAAARPSFQQSHEEAGGRGYEGEYF